MPQLIQLVYYSRAWRPVKLAELAGIFEKAQANNRERGIGGKLCFDGGHFMQVLEGDRATVSATYQRISLDGRHTDLTLMAVTEMEARTFPDWTTTYCGVSEASKNVLKEHGLETLTPATMTASAAVELLRALPTMASLTKKRPPAPAEPRMPAKLASPRIRLAPTTVKWSTPLDLRPEVNGGRFPPR